MTKPVGSLTPRNMNDVFKSSDSLLDVMPVVVSMLLSIRNTWGGPMERYDAKRSFFKDPSWAKYESEKQRKAGTSFRVDEVPALRLDGAERSLVLVSFNTNSPFGDWVEEVPQSSLKSFRVGLGVRKAVAMLGQLDHADQSEDRGIAVLDIARGIPLMQVQVGACRSWSSWPARKRQQWILKHESDAFTATGARDSAMLFARHSGEDTLEEARATLRGLGAPESEARHNLELVYR